MKVLVVGSGAREHAIATALACDPTVEEITIAPGNPGMKSERIHVCQIDPSNHAALAHFMQENTVDLAIIGPEVPLMQGIVDDLTQAGFLAFGPTRAAAKIEGSKDYAKQLMIRANVPTAAFQTFDTLEQAATYVQEHGAPIVIKADGLAGGKGVTVAMSIQEALDALNMIFIDVKFGEAGAKVVIEDFLEGEEFSLMSFVDGRRYWPMPISQDHKRAFDGDKGPNTGGMGAYSPVPQISEELVQEALARIVEPTINALADAGTPFRGVLYAGLIATNEGPKVIEFNARFGDPETEAVLPLLRSGLGEAIHAICTNGEPVFEWDNTSSSFAVVLAAQGYPQSPETGYAFNLNLEEKVHAYYAGVSLSEIAVKAPVRDNYSSTLLTSSGRVCVVQTQSETLQKARDYLYDFLSHQHFEGVFYRNDIAHRALKV